MGESVIDQDIQEKGRQSEAVSLILQLLNRRLGEICGLNLQTTFRPLFWRLTPLP